MTHYEVLGVAPGAPLAEIRSAYHRQARRWHPDFHTASGAEDAGRARRRMQQVNEAWTVLRDPVERRRYDRTIGVPVDGDPVRRHFTGAGPGPGGAGTSERFDAEVALDDDDDHERWVPRTPPGRPRPLVVAPVVLAGTAIAAAALSLVLGPALLAVAGVAGVASLVLFLVVPMMVMSEARKR